MKKLLINLIIVFAFTSCSLNINFTTDSVDSSDIQKKEERDYDSLTENKIKNSMKTIIDQLLTENIKDEYDNIYVEEVITSSTSDEKYSTKFENHLSKLAKNDLQARGFETDSLEEISLKIRYKQFGTKGILVNTFLIDRKNKNIISSSKSIIPVNSCSVLSINCIEKPRTIEEPIIESKKSINTEKRTIGIDDSNSNNKPEKKPEEKVNFSLIDYK